MGKGKPTPRWIFTGLGMSDIRVSASRLSRFVGAALKPFGMKTGVCASVVTHLVEANLTGMDSHGVQQIIGYADSLQNGRINPHPTLREVKGQGSLLLMDGDGGPGQYGALQAIKKAMALARKTGIGFVGLRNSNHFGMAGFYARMAAREGFVSFVSSDTNVVDLVPFGGKGARVGNNPLAWGVPAGDGPPVVLDMACGMVSGGKVKNFHFQGKSTPSSWGVDALGQPTRDPSRVVANLAASYKMSGMALVMDLLCGPLLGTMAGFFKKKAIHNAQNGTGHIFLVLTPSVFGHRKVFEGRVRDMLKAYKGNQGGDILWPGEKEEMTRKERLRSGIPIPKKLLEALEARFGNTTRLLRPSLKTGR